MAEIKNAIISEARITIEDHDVLDAWLTLDYGGSGQGFGGWVLAPSPRGPHWPGKGNYAGIFIRRVLDTAGVMRWDQLVGKAIRARIGDKGTIEGIGHIVKDEWFIPEEAFRSINAREAAPT